MPERHGTGETVALVAEAPGNEEVIRGRPLIGAAGRLTTMTLARMGISRNNVVLDSALLCQPPLNDLKRFLHKTQKANKKLADLGKATTLDPVTACRPHLYRQAQETPNMLLLGRTPYWGLTGDRKAIRKIRGALAERWLYQQRGQLTMWRHKVGMEAALPSDALHLRLVPTLHPAFILRSRVWEPAFVKDFQRFFRWISGTLQWTPPQWKALPTPAQLEAFLFDPSTPFHGSDIETDGKNPYVARIRCIQISNPAGDGWVVPFRSLDGSQTLDGSGPPVVRWNPDTQRREKRTPTAYYNPSDAAEIKRILRAWHLDPRRTVVGHNYGYFDVAALWRALNIPATAPCPGLLDSILAFRACHSDLKRDLYTLGTMYTDVPDWKAADDDRKVAVDPRSDQELWEYGMTDSCVTARVALPLLNTARNRDQMGALELDHKVQHIARQMNRIGMYVDETARAEKERELAGKKTKLRNKMADLVGNSTFNPASTQQLGRLFYSDWGLPVLHMTPVGDPSTDDTTLFKLIHNKVLDKRQRQVVDTLRSLRKVEKELGTYVLKLRRWNDYRKNSKGEMVGGLVGPDGRVHPHYNVHCYDGETEILTARGWVRFDALEDGASVAQWWADDGRIDFTQATTFQRDCHEGEMVKFVSKGADLLVTPHHRMPLQSAVTGKVVEKLARDLPKPGGLVSGWYTLHAGQWAGGPGLGLSEAEVRLLAMTQADGHLCAGNRGLLLSFRKVRKITRCRELLDRAEVSYSESPPTTKTPEHTFYVQLAHLPKCLDLLGPSKCFGSWLLQLDRREADVLLDEIWYWDAVAAKRTQYASTNKVNTDWLQVLLVLSGVRTNQYTAHEDNPGRATLHILGVKRSVRNRITAHATNERVPYKGRVYCVTVPSSWVVVRRRGKVTISGNTPSTGRISSSQPNSQNFPKHLRKLIIPAPGMIFVGADYDQIELRLICAVAGVTSYLEVFVAGGDPHGMTALMVYGKLFEAELRKSYTDEDWAYFQRTGVTRKATKPTALYSSLRGFAKTFVYAVLYGGTAKTVYENVSTAEDAEGNLLFEGMELREVRAAYDAWMRNAHQIPAWWDLTWDFARKNKYVVEPILGRRRDFPTFERNEILNMPIQGGAGVIMGQGLVRLVEAIPYNAWSEDSGVINQCHDAVTVQVPQERGAEACAILEESLTARYDNLPVTFGVEAQTAETWKDAA